MPNPAQFPDQDLRELYALIDAYKYIVPLCSYPSCDDLKQLPESGGLNHNAYWAALKLVRTANQIAIPLTDSSGQSFKYSVPSRLVEVLHQIDRWKVETSGATGVDERLLASMLRKEAISSAVLAGARASQAGAEDLLRCGRQPGDRSERMIFNQHCALEAVQGLGTGALSPAVVLELHRRMTEGTLDIAGASGRLRRDGEPAGLQVPAQDACTPPPAAELERRLESMCAFANGETPDFFVHPVVRAIFLHFWLAHERPFVDGNGRTARILFRWAMLRQGYPLFALVAISPVLLQDPARYSLAFCHTETDDNDLTYFLLHQGGVISASMEACHNHAMRHALELRSTETGLPGFAALNPRQQALIAHALRQPGARYVIAGHQRSHGVTHQTARDDLFDLTGRELLMVGKEGRTYFFRVAPDLPQLLQSTGGRRRRSASSVQSDELPTNLL
jgi:Fic family protein